jgi:phosphoribosyl 1,2-cyclic phosphodiesterase
MHVTFWGVRGSVPWATAASIGHGCNTPCLEVRDRSTGNVLILDGGSGIVGVGQALERRPRPIPVLLTHYHWDHMQGLPFFDPFYKPSWDTEIWAPRLGEIDAAWVETIFQNPFYPMPFDQLPSKPSLRLLSAGETGVGGFTVTSYLLNHPGGALAFRIRGRGGDLVYATDHEIGDPVHDAAFARFARGARALVLDAHFTPEELPAHRGWGHSSWKQCAEFAAANGIGQLWLFHHKPGRTDAEVAAIEAAADKVFAGCRAAREGLTFEV